MRLLTATWPAIDNAISTDAKKGLKLFIGKAGCVGCHNTPLFSDDDFHVIGLQIDTTPVSARRSDRNRARG